MESSKFDRRLAEKRADFDRQYGEIERGVTELLVGPNPVQTTEIRKDPHCKLTKVTATVLKSEGMVVEHLRETSPNCIVFKKFNVNYGEHCRHLKVVYYELSGWMSVYIRDPCKVSTLPENHLITRGSKKYWTLLGKEYEFVNTGCIDFLLKDIHPSVLARNDTPVHEIVQVICALARILAACPETDKMRVGYIVNESNEQQRCPDGPPTKRQLD